MPPRRHWNFQQDIARRIVLRDGTRPLHGPELSLGQLESPRALRVFRSPLGSKLGWKLARIAPEKRNEMLDELVAEN